MSGPGPTLQVDEVTGTDPEPICAVLREGYGEDRFATDWFAWKHLEGPWGRSRVFVATLDERRVGVVFCLPWRFHGPSGPVPGMRFVDGASLPTARGQGVFGRTIAAALGTWSEEQPDDLVVATATPDALRSHLRNGAVAVPPITPAYVAVRPSPVRLATDPSVADDVRPGPHWTTDWDGPSLRWRFRPESGHTASFDRLVEADAPTGAVTRIVSRRGLRTLVVEVAWGPRRERRALLRGLAWRARAPVMLGLHGEGTDGLPGRALVHRPPTLLAVWDRRGPAGTEDLGERGRWSLDLGDVGGAI